MTTAKQIIELWPTAAALAADIRVKPVNVRVWKYRGLIPADHWAAIAAAAERRGISLSIADLANAKQVQREND